MHTLLLTEDNISMVPIVLTGILLLGINLTALKLLLGQYRSYKADQDRSHIEKILLILSLLILLNIGGVLLMVVWGMSLTESVT